MSTDRQVIDRAKDYLASMGISESSYIVSHQGPTLIFFQGVSLSGEVKDTLQGIGVNILGG